MKYFIIMSNKNPRGIWVEADDVEDTIKHNFRGHKRVTKTEISREEYMARVYGDCGY
tara:strand:+ start:5280 stop:5450 length:171 start_codon:yes stop_codon:yes gene_type:complete